MNIRPIRDWVLVRPTKGAAKTKSGIIVPDSAQKSEYKAEIIELGEGILHEGGEIKPFAYKPGDIVIYNQFAGTKLDNGYTLVQDNDIWAIEKADA